MDVSPPIPTARSRRMCGAMTRARRSRPAPIRRSECPTAPARSRSRSPTTARLSDRHGDDHASARRIAPPRRERRARIRPSRMRTSQAGEDVTLDGRQSSDPDGAIVSYVWRNEAGAQVASGANPQVRAPDGANTFTLTVTDNGELTDYGHRSHPRRRCESAPTANAGAESERRRYGSPAGRERHTQRRRSLPTRMERSPLTCGAIRPARNWRPAPTRK